MSQSKSQETRLEVTEQERESLDCRLIMSCRTLLVDCRSKGRQLVKGCYSAIVEIFTAAGRR